MKRSVAMFVFLLMSSVMPAQPQIAFPVDAAIPGICDGCGNPDDPLEPWRLPAVMNWGYGYADLQRDLLTWSISPYVRIDSIGASVQNRALWKLTITSPAPPLTPRRTVFMHARTHPNEVQTTSVINQIIAYLLSDQPYAERLREHVTFHIVPMYNPDGVELEYGRQNANLIDLERDWETDAQQPESAALKREFTRLLNSSAPVDIALNLHSALACQRYFVYHSPNGTSEMFAINQRRFIESVRSYFPDGIQPWNYNVTWDTGRPALFPESWWWRMQQEKVLALTYEDMNCATAGQYDQTAFAILHGIGDYLGIAASSVAGEVASDALAGVAAYPNPFIGSTTISYGIPRRERVTIRIVDPLGRVIEQLVDGDVEIGQHEIMWNARGVPAGVYVCQVVAGGVSRSVAVSVVR